MISVHDNLVYGCSLDLKDLRLTLHTCFEERSPHEFTDVVFNGVLAHNFDYILPHSILFDIEEIAPTSIVEANAALFEETWRYGWPAINYGGDLALLINALQNQDAKGFEIQSSYGLSGWVLCKSCERVCREEAATIN